MSAKMRLLLCPVLLCACGMPRRASRPAADAVWLGGRVYTMASPRRAQALAARGGRLVFVGSDRDAEAFIGPDTRVERLAGKAVLPGFIDSHVHPMTSGVALGECGLGGLEKPEQVVEKVAACAGAAPQGWVRGGGWELPVFKDASPDKALLERAAPGRLVYLDSADGHSAWVSASALEKAGVSKDTPDPPGGRIERGPDGEPSGTLREEAMELVERLLPEYRQEDLMAGARRALRMAAGYGLTALHEAAADERMLSAYAELERRGELTARVDASYTLSPSSPVPDLEALRARYQGKLLRLTGGKIFADGVLEARTGAVLEPYLDRGGLGSALWTQAAFDEAAAELDRRGFQVHVHAVGDRAARMALDAIAEARRRNGPGGPTHEIVHLELVDPADLPRFKTLRVAAGFQPLWAWRDPYIVDLTEPALGPERSARLYPLGSALRAGAPLACGSDWSVSSMNPWEAVQVGATRRGPDEGPGPAWLPEERLPLDALLRCYTAGGAEAGGLETGRLEPGRPADFVVLDRDPYAEPLDGLKRVKVLETWLEGRKVYSE